VAELDDDDSIETGRCIKCRGGPIVITSRTPHVVLGRAYERRVYECRNCGHVVSRDVIIARTPRKRS
jgi:transposase